MPFTSVAVMLPKDCEPLPLMVKFDSGAAAVKSNAAGRFGWASLTMTIVPFLELLKVQTTVSPGSTLTVPDACSCGLDGDDVVLLCAPSTHCSDLRSNEAPGSV